MERAKIGAILRGRIKECGYTQEEFAEKAGVGLSTLKKQMKGDTLYDYECLDLYANLLNCSYDYLLGYSESTEREYHDVKMQTGLSDVAIKTLCEFKTTENEMVRSIAKYIYLVLDKILCDNNLLLAIVLYCGQNKPEESVIESLTSVMCNNVFNTKVKEDEFMDMGMFSLSFVVKCIEELRNSLKDKFHDDMREDLNKIKDLLKLQSTQK